MPRRASVFDALMPDVRETNSRNLDVLRATAVLIVLGVHLFDFFAGGEHAGPFSMGHLGRWGVLMFFVHTSLVLMQSLERSPDAGWNRARQFYIRRGLRLYPLAIVCVLIVVTCQVPAVPKVVYGWIGWQGLASNLALTTNLTRSPETIGPLWSLPYEAQMYVVLPFLFVLSRRRHGALSIVGLAVVVAIAASVLTPHLPYQAKLLLYVPCFLAGVLAYATRSACRVVPAWLWPLWIVAIGSVYSTQAGPMWTAWLACLFLGASIPYFREVRSRPLAWGSATVAKYSYGIYLAHSPLIWLMFVYGRSWPAPIQFGGFLVAVIAVPMVLFHLVEAPMIRIGTRIAAGRPPLSRSGGEGRPLWRRATTGV